MVAGDVPDSLKGKRVLSLDLAAMVAGAKYRGEFEERLKAVLEEIKDAGGQIITVLDNFSRISIEIDKLALTPLLESQQVMCVSLPQPWTTFGHEDPVMKRRFQEVFVGEPSVEDTIQILRGIQKKYEAHHGVRITDAALVAAATLSDRYITGRQLPDKAIDLIDEAASRLRMEIESSPEEIDQLRHSVDRLKMDEFALANETDDASRERLEKLRQDLADAEERLRGLESRWEQEKASIEGEGELHRRLDQLRVDADRLLREGDMAAASEIQYGRIPALETQIEAAAAAERSEIEPLVGEEVGPREIEGALRQHTTATGDLA